MIKAYQNHSHNAVHKMILVRDLFHTFWDPESCFKSFILRKLNAFVMSLLQDILIYPYGLKSSYQDLVMSLKQNTYI